MLAPREQSLEAVLVAERFFVVVEMRLNRADQVGALG